MNVQELQVAMKQTSSLYAAVVDMKKTHTVSYEIQHRRIQFDRNTKVTKTNFTRYMRTISSIHIVFGIKLNGALTSHDKGNIYSIHFPLSTVSP